MLNTPSYKSSFSQTRLTVLLASLFFMLSSVFSAAAKDISQEQFQQIVKSKQTIVLLDVRTENEFKQGHIANALNIPYDSISMRINELPQSKDTKVVIYCRSGRRAEVARGILAQEGFTNLDHLDGDFNAWQANKMPIVISAD